MPQAFVQRWEEWEQGRGERLDGYSLHATHADAAAYVKEYWAKMPKDAPSKYSRPRGVVYTTVISREVLVKIQASKNGIRVYSSRYPGMGGKNRQRQDAER